MSLSQGPQSHHPPHKVTAKNLSQKYSNITWKRKWNELSWEFRGSKVTSRIPEGRGGKAKFQPLVRRRDKGSPTLIPYASKSISRSCKGKERSQLLPLCSPGSSSWGWLVAKGTHVGPLCHPNPDWEGGAFPKFIGSLILIYLPSFPPLFLAGQVLPRNKRDQLINSLILSTRSKKRKRNNSISGLSSATSPLCNPG